MTSRKNNAEVKPFTFVRELREFAEAKRVRDAANATYKRLAERAAATMKAAGQWPESVDEKSVYTVPVGKTASLVQEVTMRSTRKIDETAAVDGLKKAREALEALEAGDTAAALKALQDVATPESIITVKRVPVRSYSVTL